MNAADLDDLSLLALINEHLDGNDLEPLIRELQIRYQRRLDSILHWVEVQEQLIHRFALELGNSGGLALFGQDGSDG